MRYLIYVICCSLVIIYYGCSCGCPVPTEEEITNKVMGKGEYNLVMEDSSGVKILDGVLKVVKAGKNAISGSYSLTKVYMENFPGLYSMKGVFSGSVDSSSNKVFINTNPKVADNNVTLNLEQKNNKFEGYWTYRTITTFEPLKGTCIITKK